MKRIFISVPMSGRSDEEVRNEIEEIRDYISHNMFNGEKIIFVDNLDAPDPRKYIPEEKIVTENLFYLGTAIQRLGVCHAVFFANGWKDARGCRIEHEVCKEYKIISYCFDKVGKHAIIADTMSH